MALINLYFPKIKNPIIYRDLAFRKGEDNNIKLDLYVKKRR